MYEFTELYKSIPTQIQDSSASQSVWEAYFCGSYIKPGMNQTVFYIYLLYGMQMT